MNRLVIARAFAFGTFLFLLAGHLTKAQQKAEWTWKDADHKPHTRAELDKILREHGQWIETDGKSGSWAELHGADLSGAKLEAANLNRANLNGAKLGGGNLSHASLMKADLDGADLSGVKLEAANLNQASLMQADLTGAYGWNAKLEGANLDGAWLWGAKLIHADLNGATLIGANLNLARLMQADLSGASLWSANLEGTYLEGANLNGAHLYGANLNGAHLNGANLNDAHLNDADLSRAIFEPKLLPELRGIAAAKNLELLTYDENPDALAQLRKQFQDGGFREQERKITYALKRRETALSWEGCKSRKLGDKTRAILSSPESNLANCGSFILNRVFFDWTCQSSMG
jgi:uncharacterized protein YjbI with pentapeptide repeats